MDHISEEAFNLFAEEQRRARVEKAVETLHELAEQYGADVYSDGDVLRFKKQFTLGGASYLYAAIKANGLWYLSGPMSGGAGRDWVNLVLWLIKGVPVEGYEIASFNKVNTGSLAQQVASQITTRAHKAEVPWDDQDPETRADLEPSITAYDDSRRSF